MRLNNQEKPTLNQLETNGYEIKMVWADLLYVGIDFLDLKVKHSCHNE